VELRILDGADSIGGTKVFLNTGASRLLLDFGINYKRFGLYFEEYLKPRSSQGVADLWQLGLIPPCPDLYRPDLLVEGLASAGDELAWTSSSFPIPTWITVASSAWCGRRSRWAPPRGGGLF